MDRISRRTLVALAAALPAAAQQTAPPVPSTPDEELQAARGQCRANSEQLSKVALPIGTEPATHFNA